MRSLFYKIFLSFLLITLLASITTAMISYWARIGPYAELKNRLEHLQYQTLTRTLSVTGLTVEKILATSGTEEAVRFLRDAEKATNTRLRLLAGPDDAETSHSMTKGTADLVAAASRTGRMQFTMNDTSCTAALPLTTDRIPHMVLMGSAARIFWPPVFIQKDNRKGFLSRLPLHLPLGLPLLVLFFIAASGCYLLAHSLTAPLQTLRNAVQQMTRGDFSIRVPPPGRRVDEIAELSRDFNIMATHIESLLQAQKRLLRDISHELRSPLTRLNVALELARKKGAEAGSYLERIEKESQRMNELVEQLITLTRLEGKGKKTGKEAIYLPDLLQEIVSDASFEADGLDRCVALRQVDRVTILGSREQLGRALENVIRNGLRYTAKGTVVEIDVVAEKKEVAVTIRDHGPGVPDTDLVRIFKPFFRVAEARERDSGGAGIGLAIARQAVLMHGGSIRAANMPRGGLSIEIRLPLLKPSR